MIYRVAIAKDHTAIKELVDATGYYNPIDPGTMGGRWVLAEHDGVLHACAWVMLEPPNAYIDYWVGTGRTAARLLAEVGVALKSYGITMVRAMIHETNKNAIRLACHGLGAYGGKGYALIAKELK